MSDLLERRAKYFHIEVEISRYRLHPDEKTFVFHFSKGGVQYLSLTPDEMVKLRDKLNEELGE